MQSYVLTTLSAEEVVTKQDLQAFEDRILEKIAAQTNAPSTANRLSRKELAKKLKVSEVTIWDWTKKGYLSFSRMGRKVYYQEDIVEKEFKQIRLKRAS